MPSIESSLTKLARARTSNLELDMPERTTEDYEGPACQRAGCTNAALLGDDNDEVELTRESARVQPVSQPCWRRIELSSAAATGTASAAAADPSPACAVGSPESDLALRTARARVS